MVEAGAQVGRIVQLEEAVVNRIAAGEVVVRPANALKELIENSLDAGSRHIMVMVKAGGLKMLRIEDDGHGIRTEDLPILCERFTTSKLRKYEDLSSISTFGFRGEALASISHVAHVTVTTMTAQDTCARMAQYSCGKLRAPPRPCAGTRGTTLVAEDLFYNNPTRRQALGKDSVEHAKVLEVVQKYAVHYPQVSFACRKAGSAVAELHTPGGDGTSAKEVIAIIYGQNLARELFAFEATSEDPRFSLKGFATGPNWTARGFTLTLFINHRLVESGPLRRAVEAVYAPVLPRHQHPWVYLSLELDPATIDVNVHPTKMEVQFLNEDFIAQKLQEAILERLREHGGSRTFEAQGVLVSARPFGAAATAAALVAVEPPPAPAALAGSGASDAVGSAIVTSLDSQAAPTPATFLPLAPPAEVQQRGVAERGAEVRTGPKRVELNPLRVRTDHRQLSLESVWRDTQASQPTATPAGPAASPTAAPVAGGAVISPSKVANAGIAADDLDMEDAAERRDCFEEAQALTSVAELRAAAMATEDAQLSKSLNQSVYVGPVNHELVLLQCGAALCLVNLAILARQCAYQRMLRLLGGVGRIWMRKPLPLQDILRIGILDPDSGYNPVEHVDVDVDGLVEQFRLLLDEKAEMLHEYFMLDIREGFLYSVPNALGLSSDVGLNFDGLPLFLVRLCAEVNWTEERPCLEGICRAAADFSVSLLLPDEAEVQQAESTASRRAAEVAEAARALSEAVEAGEFEDVGSAAAAAAGRKRARLAGPDVLQSLRWLHEAVRRDGACRWPAIFGRDRTVTELVSLDQLYRIFERC